MTTLQGHLLHLQIANSLGVTDLPDEKYGSCVVICGCRVNFTSYEKKPESKQLRLSSSDTNIPCIETLVVLKQSTESEWSGKEESQSYRLKRYLTAFLASHLGFHAVYYIPIDTCQDQVQQKEQTEHCSISVDIDCKNEVEISYHYAAQCLYFIKTVYRLKVLWDIYLDALELPSPKANLHQQTRRQIITHSSWR